jgi:predicted transcriptional regulator
MFVSDIMSTCLAECTEDTSLEEVFGLIRKCDHGLVVVVDSVAHRVPIGVVTERSICEQIIGRGRNPRSLAAGSVIDSRIKRVSKSDLAETLATIDPTEVAAIVAVDDNRRPCGLVTKESLRNIRIEERPVYAAPATMVVRTPIAPRRISEIPAFGWIQ